MSTIERNCRTRSLTTRTVWRFAASTRSDGCCTWRSPVQRTRCCCPVTTGERPSPSRAVRRHSSKSSRRSSSARMLRASPAVSSSSGPPLRPMVSSNPLRDNVVEAVWPVDPAGSRRDDVGRGAALVAARCRVDSAMKSPTATRDGHPMSTRCSPNATARPSGRSPPLPAQLSVSTLVELGRDPECGGATAATPVAHAA